MVNVIWKGKRKLMRVHRLVAYTYLPNPNNLPMVNHKDEDKSNNNDWNLEWCDNQYNAEYSLAKNFIFINPEGEEVKVFNLNKFCRDNSLPLTTMARLHKKGGKARNGWSAKEVIYRC